MDIRVLNETIGKLIKDDENPVVIFSAMWPLMKVLEIPIKEIPHTVLRAIIDTVGKGRSLLMPSFGHGYKNGVCDLDKESSTAGILSELFRKAPQTRRSLSAFFSYNILGPHTEEFISLQPFNAWGEGSTYEWMEQKNVHFLMLGTHPTHCSYLHRMEWLNRKIINYRYEKDFEGILIRDGVPYTIKERLYVRCLEPNVVNDFTVIYKALREGGMTVATPEGIHIAHMRAENMKDVFMKLLKKDPFLTVKNRADFER